MLFPYFYWLSGYLVIWLFGYLVIWLFVDMVICWYGYLMSEWHSSFIVHRFSLISHHSDAKHCVSTRRHFPLAT